MVQFEQVRKRKESVHFIDYFFVCGLPENENIRIYKHLDECSFSDSHRKRFISSVLCHFPENIPENPWKAGELWKLCTPGGIDIFIGEEKFKPKERFHAFLLTREDGSKYFGHVLTFFEPCINKGQQDIISSKLQLRGGERADGKQIFAEKCIGFITQRGFINTCEQVLHHLFSTFVVDHPPSDHVPIESFIFNLLYEIPLVAPNQGCKLSCLTNAVGDRSIVIQNPGRSELPLLDVHLSQLFRMLGGAANVISLLTSILLEHQILLISKDCRLLMHAGEGITALLFPFQWQHTFVSVLPHDLAMHFFHAPVPYIIGVVVHPDMKLHLRRALEVDQCYVDLDNAQVECPEDQPSFPEQVELCEKLNIFFDRYNNKMASLPNDEPASQERPKKADRSKKTTSGDMVEMKSSGVRRRRGADLVVRIIGDEGEDDPQVDSLHANVMLTVTTTTDDADSKMCQSARFRARWFV